MPKPVPLGHAARQRREVTPEDKIKQLGPWGARFGNVPKGTKVPETITQACPRVKVADFPPGHIPTKYFEALEHNQLIASCCRHPENHEIAAFKSHPDEKMPDIYILYCTCGRLHRRYLASDVDDHPRPLWSAA